MIEMFDDSPSEIVNALRDAQQTDTLDKESN